MRTAAVTILMLICGAGSAFAQQVSQRFEAAGAFVVSNAASESSYFGWSPSMIGAAGEFTIEMQRGFGLTMTGEYTRAIDVAISEIRGGTRLPGGTSIFPIANVKAPQSMLSMLAGIRVLTPPSRLRFFARGLVGVAHIAAPAEVTLLPGAETRQSLIDLTLSRYVESATEPVILAGGGVRIATSPRSAFNLALDWRSAPNLAPDAQSFNSINQLSRRNRVGVTVGVAVAFGRIQP